MRIVLLGPPGSGKGTQARLIQARFGIPQVSTGDIFRKAIAGRTSLGMEVEKYISDGILVPDSLTIDLVRERLDREDVAGGFVLDGFPRTVPQAVGIEAILRDHGWSLNAVINIEAPPEILVQRLSLRRTCPACGMMYHAEHCPPETEGKCTRCETVLEIRPDDNEDTVRKRLEVYYSHTAPLVDYYKGKSQIVSIDGSGGVDEIFAVIQSVIREKCGELPAQNDRGGG